MSKHFSRYFPTPSFLTRPASGLDLSDRSVKFVELEKKGKTVTITKRGRYDLPSGIIENGELIDRKTLKEVLGKLRNEHNLRYIIASLPEELSYVFTLQLPAMEKEEEIWGSIELQLEEHIPVPAESVVFDYERISNIKGVTDDVDVASDHIDVAVSAFPKSSVLAYLNTFLDSGLEPLAFELEGHALTRSILTKDDTKTCMIVDFGATRTGISIVIDGVLEFTASVAVGGRDLTGAIMKDRNVSLEEAIMLKNRYGLIRTSKENVYETLIATSSVLQDEIGSRVRFWNKKSQKDEHGNRKVNQVLLAGGEVAIPGLVQILKTSLGTEVKVGNPWANVELPEKKELQMDQADTLRYATAIGLALRGLKL